MACLVVMAVFLQPGPSHATCALSGSGTASAPYLVGTYADLNQVGTNCSLGASYRMTADIDASPSNEENNGGGFVPIGDSLPFTGEFHGAGHQLENLLVNDVTDGYVGVFGQISAALIDSLGILNEEIIGNWNTSGTEWIGGIVGLNSGGVIRNCSSQTATVSGTGSYFGRVLIAGAARAQDDIARPRSAYVGGIAGANLGEIRSCFSVVGDSGFGVTAGGLVGWNGSTGTIDNCYCLGRVIGTGGDEMVYDYNSIVGGLAGQNDGKIGRSYAVNTVVSNDSTTCGGLVGSSGGTVINCYWDKQAFGETTGIGTNLGDTSSTVGFNTSQMQDSTNFVGFSFAPDSAWTIIQGQTFPLLRGMPGGTAPQITAQAAATSTMAISHRPVHIEEAALYRVGGSVDLELPVSSLVRTVDALGHQVAPEREFAAGTHELDLPKSGSMLFVQVRVGSSTSTLSLLLVR